MGFGRRFAGLLVGVGLWSGLTGTVSGAINTDTGLTPAEGQWIVRSQTVFKSKTDDRTGENRKLQIIANRNVLIYGLRDGTSLFTAIPFLYKAQEVNSSDGGRSEREDAGIGDVQVFVKQRLWRQDRLGRTNRLALIGGLELPTGDTSEANGLGKFPRPIQLGSGSWDPFMGAVATHQEQRYELSADVVYQFNTEARGFEFGDALSHDAGLWVRVWPGQLPEWGTPSAIHAVLELNGIFNQKNTVNGDLVGDLGGYTLYLSPGIQWVGPRWIVEGSLQFPVIQDLNRAEIREAGPTYVIGVRVTF
ncbi:MAG: transporter [Candidatus Omnitrophica bacterium]|nr:transporter [Candidatus Omnitrophota bacterium]